MSWATNGPITDPAEGEILADTGALTLGITATLICTTTSACTFELVRRNAANTADVKTLTIPVLLSPIFFTSVPLGVSVNERFQIRCVTSVTGTVQASLLY